MVELPVPPATDRRVWDHVDTPTLRAIAGTAVADRGTPWPVPLARDYARYFRDGDRATYETVNWLREKRVTRAAVLAAATLEPAWLDEVADGVTLLCEQSSWCWPAHDDTFQRHGAVVPTVTDPVLDLGAGEVAAQLAWIDHLLGAQLDERYPGLRARIRHEVDRRVLTPFRTRRDWHWLGRAHNWNPWIHSNVLVAALVLADDPAPLIDLVVEGLDRYAASLPPDGAIDEGFLYWWHGAAKLLEAYDLLGVELPPAARAAVAFPHRVHLGGDWYLNHADGPARLQLEVPWDVLHRAARRAGDPTAEAFAAARRGETLGGVHHGLGPLLRALTDPAWAAAKAGPPPPAEDVWFPSTQVLIARGPALTLAFKGGHNDENHNHNDVGSVVVALRGVPVLVDPGRPTYTGQTFGPDRYDIWTMRSTWHNTPTMQGREQQPGREYAARDVTPGRLDLAGAYDVSGHWWRTASLDGDVVTVSDRWELDHDEPGSVIHVVLAGEVTLSDGHAVVTALDGAGVLTLAWLPPAPASMVVRELDDPALSDVWGARLTRLDIDVSGLGPKATLDLTVKEQR